MFNSLRKIVVEHRNAVTMRLLGRKEWHRMTMKAVFCLLFFSPNAVWSQTDVASSDSVEPSQRPFHMAVSTNLLYDVALVPTLGAEVWIGNRYSVKADYSWAWWSNDSKHRYWRIEGGSVEGRVWFPRKKNYARFGNASTGFHAGLYAGMLTYDLEFGGKGWQAPRWSWHAGVSGGYTMPIGKRLTLDFNIGIGYHWGKYYEYEPHSGRHPYWWTATKQRKWIGPTKAEISLVWHIGKYSKRSSAGQQEKGGLR